MFPSVTWTLTVFDILWSQVLLTNGNLELIDEGIEFVVNVDKESLDRYVPPIASAIVCEYVF